MTIPAIDTHVTWTRGAIGLSGPVVEHVHIPDAPPTRNVMLLIETARGDRHEYPSNVVETSSLTMGDSLKMYFDIGELEGGHVYSEAKGWEKRV